LVESNRSRQAEPQHPETHQERYQRNVHPGEATRLFPGENPARDTAIDPGASEPHELYAYSLEDLQTIISLLPEPASTAFAVAAFMGLRQGEIQGLLWENYRDWVIYVSRSIWNGRVTDSKTRKGRPPVPVIRQLAERLEMHRLRCGNPQSGPIFAMQSANRSRCSVLSTESSCPC